MTRMSIEEIMFQSFKNWCETGKTGFEQVRSEKNGIRRD